MKILGFDAVTQPDMPVSGIDKIILGGNEPAIPPCRVCGKPATTAYRPVRERMPPAAEFERYKEFEIAGPAVFGCDEHPANVVSPSGEQSRDYAAGFEHALRNVIATLDKDIAAETNEDRKLGLELGRAAAARYQGFMG